MNEFERRAGPEVTLSPNSILPGKIKLHFFYSSHESPETAVMLPDRIREFDVYIPEIAGWSKRTAEVLRRITKGDRRIYERVLAESEQEHDRWKEMLTKALYGTYKPLLFIDVEEDSEIFDETKVLLKSWLPTLPPNFDDALEAIKARTKSEVRNSKEREDYMLTRLVPALGELVWQHPRLQRMNQVRVLMSLGAAHTRVYHVLSKVPENKGRVTREFATRPHLYTVPEEVIRKYIFDRPVTNFDLARRLARYLISRLFWGGLMNAFSRWDQRMIFIRKVIDQLDYDDIKSLYESLDWEKTKYRGGFYFNRTVIVERVEALGKSILAKYL